MPTYRHASGETVKAAAAGTEADRLERSDDWARVTDEDEAPAQPAQAQPRQTSRRSSSSPSSTASPSSSSEEASS